MVDVLKQNDVLKCRIYASHEVDQAKGCSCIKLNCQSFEAVEMFCYLCDTVGARRGAGDNILARTKSR